MESAEWTEPSLELSAALSLGPKILSFDIIDAEKAFVTSLGLLSADEMTKAEKKSSHLSLGQLL